MKAPTPKTTVWAVRYDGSVIDEYQVADGGTDTVVIINAAGQRQRWRRIAYENKFGATREDAVKRFVEIAERGCEEAAEELADANGLLGRAQALLKRVIAEDRRPS